MRSTGPTSDPPQIGRYQVIRHLATGGMAQIYLARMGGMASFERHVVLKTILANRANDRRFINMFLDEAKLAATLNHQNIAQVYEVDQADGAYYMAMEYVHGENCRAILENSIRRQIQIPIELAVLIIAGAAAGLHHAHERKGKSGQALNIVHRDVSPANIMVGYDGSVKVLDFGIAKAEERYTQTVGSTIKGKYGYMSPEQCKGKSIDRRSDIFALGIVLYELTTQRRAFRGRDDFDTMKRIVGGDLVMPSSLVADYPVELEGVILKALSAEPEDRYATAQEMIEALDVFTQRSKLTSTNTAMARFMVQLFGEPREPWESQHIDGRQPGSSSPMVNTGVDYAGQDDQPTTVLGGSSTLPPSNVLVPPRVLTPQTDPNRSLPVMPRTRTASVAGALLPSAPPALPPNRSSRATTLPPSRSAAPTTPPPMRGAAPTTPPPMRGNSPTVPPPRRKEPTGAPPRGSGITQPPPVSRRALAPSSPRVDAAAPPMDRAASARGGTAPGQAVARERSPSLGPAPGEPSQRIPVSALFDRPPSSQQRAVAASPPGDSLIRHAPAAPLSIPLMPRTVTPIAAPPSPMAPMAPLPQAPRISRPTSAPVPGGEGARTSAEDSLSRVQSSVISPLPHGDSSIMTPLPRPETLASDASTSGFKYRWAIVLVLLVVLAAVGLMVAIALTSST
ncbi:MAG: protein kinase [Kofleriaceae bacterium]